MAGNKQQGKRAKGEYNARQSSRQDIAQRIACRSFGILYGMPLALKIVYAMSIKPMPLSKHLGLVFLLAVLLSCSQQATVPDPGSTNAPSAPAVSGTWWRPTPGTNWQIQYSGPLDTSLAVQVYDLDLVDTDLKTIELLHAAGRKVLCYFSAGSYEEWRSDAGQFPAATLGKPLEGWPGERWLDVRQISSLAPIMTARLDLAAQKKCDGVDPDNVDGYSNDSGFLLKPEDQLAYNRWLAAEAHKRGLAVGLKNDLDQIPQLVGDFDFAVNEQCFYYKECEKLLPFIQANKPVWGIEYQGDSSSFCPQANQHNFDTLKKKMELDAWRESCR